jgi:hypothetical protein
MSRLSRHLLSSNLAPAVDQQPRSRRSRAHTRIAFLAFAALASACNESDDDPIVVQPIDLRTTLRHWNQIAVDASGLDHAPPNVGPPHTQGEHLGPGRSARAMAIVHVAMFEAMNAIEGGYESYIGLASAPEGSSVKAAIAQSMHDTLSALFPSQASLFADDLEHDLESLAEGPAKSSGIAIGAEAAALILQQRTGDGSELPEPVYGVDYIPSDQPGAWRQDPISQVPLALGANWDQVTPFVLSSADQFRTPPPPALTSAEYTLAYNEELVFGGDGVVTPHGRTDEQTLLGIYWAYDGTPSLCAPPRLYNQIAMQLAHERDLSLMATARLLALVNVALADAGIAAWESKYHWALWRPITAIRESDPGTGPSGLGDGNPATVGDPTFTPLGAPASNLGGVDFTPPFPAYPSGHATFGGALFQTLRRFFGTDDVEFTFVSDELNGVTTDWSGSVRALAPRTFSSLSEAEEENGQSRIYLGIHWRFDKTAGILQGNQVADQVFDNLFLPAL